MDTAKGATSLLFHSVRNFARKNAGLFCFTAYSLRTNLIRKKIDLNLLTIILFAYYDPVTHRVAGSFPNGSAGRISDLAGPEGGALAGAKPEKIAPQGRFFFWC